MVVVVAEVEVVALVPAGVAIAVVCDGVDDVLVEDSGPGSCNWLLRVLQCDTVIIIKI